MTVQAYTALTHCIHSAGEKRERERLSKRKGQRHFLNVTSQTGRFFLSFSFCITLEDETCLRLSSGLTQTRGYKSGPCSSYVEKRECGLCLWFFEAVLKFICNRCRCAGATVFEGVSCVSSESQNLTICAPDTNSGKCPEKWVWTFAGVCLSHMTSAAVDRPSQTRSHQQETFWNILWHRRPPQIFLLYSNMGSL